MASARFATLLSILPILASLPLITASASQDLPSHTESALRRDQSSGVNILGFEQVSQSMGISAQMVRFTDFSWPVTGEIYLNSSFLDVPWWQEQGVCPRQNRE